MANLSLLFYRALLRGALPIAGPVMWLQARLKGKSRPRLADRLARDLPIMDPGGLWLQAVSVGEVELAKRLLQELQTRAPELPLLLTATTSTGLALARRTVGDTAPVRPCPLDLPRPIRRVLDAAQPAALVLVETELWPELIHQTGARGIPVAVVNARLSESSFARYRRIRRFLTPLLSPISMVMARSDVDGARFAVGVPESKIHVFGNIKYDLKRNEEALPWEKSVKAWAGSRPIVIAGSTMEGEEAQVLEALITLRQHGVDLFLVLAPRHPERFDAAADLLNERGELYARRSDLQGAPDKVDVMLLDTIGELGRSYRLASAAFIGGSFAPTGGHNPLEPAVWNVPVLTGPHVHNFKEVYEELITAGGAHVVKGPAALAHVLASWFEDHSKASAAGAAAREVVERNRGATRRTTDKLLALCRAGEAS